MDIKHNQKPSKVVFIDEPEVISQLHAMEADIDFNTSPIPVRESGNIVGHISFFNKHLAYIKAHPKLNPAEYISNLRTMTRVRR